MANSLPKPAKRSKAQREADLDRVAQLALEGKKQSEISVILSQERPYTLTQQTISKDLRFLEKCWRKQSFETIDFAKKLQLKSIGLIKKDAWQRLQESKRPKTVSKQGTKERRGGGNGSSPSAESYAWILKEDRYVDPRWHLVLLKCLEREAALLGLDAPKATEAEAPPPRLEDVMSMERMMEAVRKSTEIKVLKQHNLLPWQKKTVGTEDSPP